MKHDAMNYKVTVEQLEAQLGRILACKRERAERIARCEVEDSDCFLSMRAEDNQIAKIKARISIIKDGGCAWFVEYATLDGTLCDSSWVNTKYGYKLKVNMPNGEVVLTTAKTKKGLAKKGIKMVNVKRVAWADSGKGWFTPYSVYPAKLNRATGEYTDGEPIEIKDYVFEK